MKDKSTEVTSVNFQDVQTPAYYTIKEIAQKIGRNPTKINHLIFKLNKMQGDKLFFADLDRFTDEDVDKMELAFALIDDGKTYEEVISYFLNDNNGLMDINEKDTKEVYKMKSSHIVKDIVLEVNKQFTQTQQQITNDLIAAFGEEAKKLAQVSLEAMNQTKQHITSQVQDIADQNDELLQQNKDLQNAVNILIEQNNTFKDELERQCNKSTENMRMKLQHAEKQLEEKSKQLLEEKNKSLWDKIFKK